MKRIVVAIMTTISGLVLLMAYPTSTNRTLTAAGTGAGTGALPGSASASAGTPAGPGASAGTAGSSSTKATVSGTFDGAVAQTRWGPVQVRIVVQAGKITSAQTLQEPNGNRNDQIINSYALPVLNNEVVQRQSAKIDLVSGATVTSSGYAKSLQSAIDQAFGS